MLERASNTMQYTRGAFFGRTFGLASTQIGCSKRFIVMANPEEEDPFSKIKIMLNPKMISMNNTVETREEGCISMPR